jgi:hypothetical protein
MSGRSQGKNVCKTHHKKDSGHRKILPRR